MKRTTLRENSKVKYWLEISEMVLVGLEDYPAEALQGPIDMEMVGIVGEIADCQLSLKRYAKAEKSYQRALELWKDLTSPDTKTKAIGKATIYHHLCS